MEQFLSLPTEIQLQIMQEANDETLRNTRLACSLLHDIATPSFATRNFSRIHVQMTKSGIQRLRHVCSHVSIAKHIKRIVFSTLTPRTGAVDELLERLNGQDSRDPYNKLRPAIRMFSRYLEENTELAESGRMFKEIQESFEALRMNGNRDIEIEIFDDVKGRWVGFGRELQDLYNRRSQYDPDDVLRAATFPGRQWDLYGSSDDLLCRILLALERSGLQPKGLNVPASRLLSSHPWQGKPLESLQLIDRIQPKFLCDTLADPAMLGSSLRHIHIKLFTPTRRTGWTLDFNNDSGLILVLKRAKELEEVELSTSMVIPVNQGLLTRMNLNHRHFNRLIEAVPNGKLKRVNLSSLTIKAGDLALFLRQAALTLEFLTMTDLVVYGDCGALANLLLRDFRNFPRLRKCTCTKLKVLNNFPEERDENSGYAWDEATEGWEVWDASFPSADVV